MGLMNIVKLVNEFTPVLIEIERNGVCIDTDYIAELEKKYRSELLVHTKWIDTFVKAIWGDKPFNKHSPTDISKFLYSREITDKAYWWENIVENRNRFRWSKARYASELTKCTQVVYRYTVQQCGECNGKAKIFPIKKNGEPGKKYILCKMCEGTGVVYISTRTGDGRRIIAGLKQAPNKFSGVSTLGFQVTDTLLKQIAAEGSHDFIRLFAKKLGAANSTTHNLDTHIKGIKNFVNDDGILHTTFNQHVTRTGRLSSTKPCTG